MAIIRVARVLHVEILAPGDGFPNTGMQLPRGGVGEANFEFGVFTYTHRAEPRANAIFQVVTVAERGVFEAGP